MINEPDSPNPGGVMTLESVTEYEKIAAEHIQTETLSPFLQGTKIQYAWDSTSLGYLKGCPRLYYYVMIEGWQAKGEGIHLRFGIEYHTALQHYDVYRAVGMDHQDALREVVLSVI